MVQEIKFSTEANKELLEGVNTIANAVKSTFGPHGRNVIIESNIDGESPHITKDGVTVANSINLGNKFQNIGAKLVKDVALKTCKDVGDGTTTSTILTQFIINEGLKSSNFGADSFALKKGMELAVSLVKEELLKSSIKIETREDIKNIARISTNGDEELSEILTNIFHNIGEDGVVLVEDSNSYETYEETIKGLQINSGYFSPAFCITSPTVELENPYILISTKKIATLEEIGLELNKVKSVNRPVLIIAPDYSKQVMDSLITNNFRGVLQVCAIKAPGFNEQQYNYLEDISLIIGSELNRINGSKVLGEAKRIVITETSTTIFEGIGKKEDIDSKINFLKKQLESQKDLYIAGKILERIARLSSNMSILYVGALSDIELQEKKDRIDDAIHAIKAALKEGVIIGSGLALLRASKVLYNLTEFSRDEMMGINLIKLACKEPIRQLLENASEDTSKINTLLEKENNIGLNLITKEYEDFYIKGIIDPVKVVYTTIENATSVGSLFLTTNCVIINKEK